MIFLFSCVSGEQQPPSVEVEDVSLMELWATNEAQFVQQVADLSEEEKIDLVRRIMEEPGQKRSPQLCQILQQQQHCLKLLQRPHIWEYEIIREKERREDSRKKYLPTQAKSLEVVPPLPPDNCPQGSIWCTQQEATSLVKEGQIDQAKGACSSIAQDKGQRECFFQVAEQIALQPHDNSVRWALEACEYSLTFRKNCYRHVMENLSGFGRDTRSISEDLQQYWHDEATLLREMRGYFLALEANEDPMNQDVEWFDRHSAQSYAFLQQQPHLDLSIAEWKRKFRLYLEKNPTMGSIRLRNPMTSLWDQADPAVNYLSLHKRPHSTDREEDLELALLAGLIRHHFPLTTIQRENDSAIMQWMMDQR